MTNFKKDLVKHAERELQLIGFMDSEFGVSCLQFLEDLANVSNDDQKAMKELISLITKLVDRQILSPITEEDFDIEKNYIKNNEITKIQYCSRCDHIYKKDGKYWNDMAVVFKKNNSNDRIYKYQCGESSKQEIHLPYFPQEIIKKL